MPTSLRFHSSLVLQLAPELGSELLSALRGISRFLSRLHHYSILFCPYHLGAVLNAAHTLDCHFSGLAHGTGIGDLVRHPAIQQLSKSSTEERHEMNNRKWQNGVMAEGGGILEWSRKGWLGVGDALGGVNRREWEKGKCIDGDYGFYHFRN